VAQGRKTGVVPQHLERRPTGSTKGGQEADSQEVRCRLQSGVQRKEVLAEQRSHAAKETQYLHYDSRGTAESWKDYEAQGGERPAKRPAKEASEAHENEEPAKKCLKISAKESPQITHKDPLLSTCGLCGMTGFDVSTRESLLIARPTEKRYQKKMICWIWMTYRGFKGQICRLTITGTQRWSGICKVM